MSRIALSGDASGTGTLTIAAPNTNSDTTINLPTVTGGDFIVSNASGNVGIGTSSPARRLDVRGGIGMQVNEDGAGTKVITLRSDFAGVGPAVNVTTNDPLLFLTNNTEQARITAAGLFQFNSGYGSVATAFGCRAWVNFNGTTSPGTIRGSGNVSSVTFVASGDYQINFATAMPDVNYSAVANCSSNRNFSPQGVMMFYTRSGSNDIVAPTTTNFRIATVRMSDGAVIEQVYVTVSVFR
jgi:hypothetical protein